MLTKAKICIILLLQRNVRNLLQIILMYGPITECRPQSVRDFNIYYNSRKGIHDFLNITFF